MRLLSKSFRTVATSVQRRSRRQAFVRDKKNAIYTEQRSHMHTDFDNTRQAFICTLRTPQDGITEYNDVSKALHASKFGHVTVAD